MTTDIKPPRAAWRAARAAIKNCAGYRAFLADAGIDPTQIRRWSQLPLTNKRTVFGSAVEPWLAGGDLAAAGELISSSGASGLFSLGAVTRAERRNLEKTTDAALRALGAGEDSSTLLVNALAMGIGFPTQLATVAVPSTHMEMALEFVTRYGPRFDRTILLAEPIFAKALAETALRTVGPDWAPPGLLVYTGGEWIAESWRSYLTGLIGRPDSPGVFISLGAAEIGLHVLFETPQLRWLRGALAESGGFEDIADTAGRGYPPLLFSYDPRRVFVEENDADGDPTLVLTPLEAGRLLPLIRYDLGDAGQHLDAAELNRVSQKMGGPPIEGPVVAVWGVRESLAIDGRPLRVEAIKEALFASSSDIACLTGRFHLEIENERPKLTVEQRPGTVPTPALANRLGRLLSAQAGVEGRVVIAPSGAYPFHDPGDFQHKPRYFPRESL